MPGNLRSQWPHLFVSFGVFALLLLLVSLVPVPREDPRKVASYLCHSLNVISMLEVSPTSEPNSWNDSAMAAAIAVQSPGLVAISQGDLILCRELGIAPDCTDESGASPDLPAVF
jgi:hypothetical protein